MNPITSSRYFPHFQTKFGLHFEASSRKETHPVSRAVTVGTKCIPARRSFPSSSRRSIASPGKTTRFHRLPLGVLHKLGTVDMYEQYLLSSQLSSVVHQAMSQNELHGSCASGSDQRIGCSTHSNFAFLPITDDSLCKCHYMRCMVFPFMTSWVQPLQHQGWNMRAHLSQK